MTPDSARAAANAGADAIGLVFAPDSPRCIDAGTAIEITDMLPPFITPIGLFQNANAQEINDTWPWPWVQLHGGETPSMISELPERRIIRGFPFSQRDALAWNDCDMVDALLVDGSTGGTGTMFDHGELAEVRGQLTKTLILAGGLTPDNVKRAIENVRPDAVDVSSGVESSRGVKDPDLIEAFCLAVRDADAQLA